MLQLDCPDLALSRHMVFAHLSLEEFRKVIATHVEALNHAVRDIPPERMRMHICWASTQGPHHKDVPLKDIVDIVLKGRPQALSFPGANPRHGHEWKVWKDDDARLARRGRAARFEATMVSCSRDRLWRRPCRGHRSWP